MTKDDLLLKLLEALLDEWSLTMTSDEIGNDVAKLKILHEVRAELGDVTPSPKVQRIYQEVFLRDLWARGTNEGSPAQS